MVPVAHFLWDDEELGDGRGRHTTTGEKVGRRFTRLSHEKPIMRSHMQHN